MKIVLVFFAVTFPILLLGQTKEKLAYKLYVDSANHYFKLDDYERSIYFCTEAVHTIPDVPYAYGMRALCYARQEKHLEAIHDYKKVITYSENYTTPDVHFSLALEELSICDTLACLDALNKAANLDNENPDVFLLRSKVLLYRNSPHAALVDISRCIDLDSTIVEAYLIKAELLEDKDDRKGAYACYRQATKIDPDLPEIYYRMAIMKLNDGNLRSGLTNINEAIKRDSTHTTNAYFIRGNIYREMGEDEKALSDFKRHTEYYPEDAFGYYALARAKIRLKQQREALPDLNKSIELDDTDSEAFYWRGLLKFWLQMDGCTDLLKADEMGYEDAALEIKNRGCR